MSSWKLRGKEGEIVRRYLEGETCEELAPAFNTYPPTIWHCLKRRGVALRPREKRRPRPRSFEEALSPSGKWFLEYVAARQWLYEHGRWETPYEVKRRESMTFTLATVSDVRLTIEELTKCI